MLDNRLRWNSLSQSAKSYYFEFIIEKCLQSFLRDGDTCIDIGANYGSHTITMLDAVGVHGKVFAFEPSPDCFRSLKSWQSKHPNLFVYDIALSNRQGRADLHLDARHKISSLHVLSHLQMTEGVAVEVAVDRLDDLALESCALIKIDVDGEEFSCLRGGTQYLSRTRPLIFIELAWTEVPWNQESPPNASPHFFDWLKSINYQALETFTGSVLTQSDEESWNVVLCPIERAVAPIQVAIQSFGTEYLDSFVGWTHYQKFESWRRSPHDTQKPPRIGRRVPVLNFVQTGFDIFTHHFKTMMSKLLAERMTRFKSLAENSRPLVLLLFVLFFMIVPWHLLNNRLPIWDSADFVRTSQRIVAAFDRGAFEGLSAWYLDRGWRPISLPALSAPFFWAFKGDINGGVALTQYLTAFLLAGYVYAIFAQDVSRNRALLASLFIAGLSWVAAFFFRFYSELFWLAATAATLYHLLRALRSRSAAQFSLAGVWLGIAITLRPIESIVLGALPLICVVVAEYRNGKVRRIDLLVFIVQLIIAAIAAWLLTRPAPSMVLAWGLLSACVAANASRIRSYWLASPVLLFLFVSELISVVWFLVAFRELFLWAFETSFGTLAKVTDQRFLGKSPLSIFSDLLPLYSPRILAALTAVSLVSLLRCSRSQVVANLGVRFVAVALLMLIPMLIIYSVSGTSDMRRIMPVMLVLNVGLVFIALMPSGPLRRSRVVLLLLLTSFEVLGTGINGMNIQRPWFPARERWTELPAPFTGVDPNPDVLDAILKLGISQGRIAAFTYCYRDFENCENQHIRIFEPMALWTVAQARGLSLQIHFMGDLDFSRPETLAEQIKANGFDYVLIDLFDNPANVNWRDSYVNNTANFIRLYRSALPKGLTDLGCFYDLGRAICVIQA
jgi:FkbM family methyltransferase